MNESMDRARVLALGALFQAALAADQIAARGTRNNEAIAPLMHSILVLDTDRADDIYRDPQALRPGLRLLRDALTGNQRHENARQVGYALSLVQLARTAARQPDLLGNLRQRLEVLVDQRDHFPDLTAREFLHRAAGVYTSTLSTLKYRIRVQGTPAALQNEDNAAAIRALFLAGVRAAFLWHQKGGRRWQLLFSRRRLVTELDALLA